MVLAHHISQSVLVGLRGHVQDHGDADDGGAQQPGLLALEQEESHLGPYPIVTSQHSPTTLYQVSCHRQSLFF